MATPKSKTKVTAPASAKKGSGKTAVKETDLQDFEINNTGDAPTTIETADTSVEDRKAIEDVDSSITAAVITRRNPNGGTQFGFAAHEALRNRFIIDAFEDTDRWTRLEFILNALRCETVIMSKTVDSSAEKKLLREICERNLIELVEVDGKYFKSDDIVQDLERLLKGRSGHNKTDVYHEFLKKDDLLQHALAAIIARNRLLEDAAAFNRWVQ